MSAHIVEHLEVRLAREVPGALLVQTSALGPLMAWTVVVGDEPIARASSRREAANKAMEIEAIKRGRP